MSFQLRGVCGRLKASWDNRNTCLSCTLCTVDHKCSICSSWDDDIWQEAICRRTFLGRKRPDVPSTDGFCPVTLQTSDDQLQHQSPGIRQDGDHTLPSESRSTSDFMATTVSRSLPDGIGQGPPVNGDWSGHRSDLPVTGHLLLMTGPTHRAAVTGSLLLMTGPTHRSSVTDDRSDPPFICY
ncbi:hypothetical protein DPMN_122440 [Dreissena polymorpha]|uniref:RecR protein domain-containing protein n=1 Tax=Dreissena polymorpha TaxID=45954 RepID=A0A9D4GPP9_DREPO|nr:hypothetical protein DPMN_122440 [Dreissena polymorpha]